MSLWKEFMDFLQEYKIFALAIAFIMGVAATTLVKSFVDNLIMPIIGVLIPGGAWKESVLAIGPVKFTIGAFVSDLIYFIIVALVIFIAVKFIMKQEKVTKV
ncbi:MAG: MscL family protein [Methanoregulaceae archaeon]|nr:MscL family protein [Methanoregulaceae archaeon]